MPRPAGTPLFETVLQRRHHSGPNLDCSHYSWRGNSKCNLVLSQMRLGFSISGLPLTCASTMDHARKQAKIEYADRERWTCFGRQDSVRSRSKSFGGNPNEHLWQKRCKNGV